MTPARPTPAVHQLLMMACSQRKRAGDTPMRALDRYQGVMYQTLRAHARPEAMPHLVILSAEHGFLWPDDPIRPYDRRMDDARATAFISDPVLAERLGSLQCIDAVFLCGGRPYRRVMEAAVQTLKLRGCIRPAAQVQAAAGGLGQQRAQLGAYLRGLVDHASAQHVA